MLIRSVLPWSNPLVIKLPTGFVFILEDDEDFRTHENLPQKVTDNEVFGRVIHHHMLEPLVRLSLSSKSDRTNYLMTLESQ